jgi:hypothetical protein
MERKSLLKNAALGISVGVVAVGLFALFKPKAAAGLFGLPVAKAEDLDWVRLAGARDVAVGSMSAVATASKQPEISGASMLAMAVIPAMDSIFVARKRGWNCQAFMHGCAAASIASLGRILLRK